MARSAGPSDGRLPGFEPPSPPIDPPPTLFDADVLAAGRTVAPPAPDLGTTIGPGGRDAFSPPAPRVVDGVAHDLPFRVEVTRSAKRRRTVGAQLVGDVLKIVVPSWMSRAEESHWIDVMSGRFLRKLSTDRVDLTERAEALARRFDLSHPKEIRWSDDMTTRWGSCTPSTRVIRISTRIAPFPDWVVDYVIVHELAHLDVAGHGDDFWRIVHRHPKSERAIGYLIAKSGDAD